LLLTDSGDDRFVAVVVVLTLRAASIAANHAIPRRPRLTVEYRDPQTAQPASLWPRGDGVRSPSVNVYVKNAGRGHAEAVEVRFDRLGADSVFNESGNNATDVDVTVHPPRFMGGTRVLGAGEEWAIAHLSWVFSAPQAAHAEWTAFARGMRTTTGAVDIPMRDSPPDDA
jgi:hypothetical protein